METTDKKKTVLVIEDDPDLREVLVLIVQSKVGAKVIETGSVKESIQAIDDHPEIHSIVADYNLGDGVSLETFQYLKKVNRPIPFILCSGSTESARNFAAGDKLAAVVNKPFKTDDLVKAIKATLGDASKGAQDSSKYCPVSIALLLKLEKVNCSLFLKLAENKYVRLTQQDDGFGKEECEKYRSKGVEVLYFEGKEAGVFLDQYVRDMCSLRHAKSLNVSEALKVTTQAHEMLHRVITSLDVSSKAIDLANECTAMAISSLNSDPEMLPYLSKMGFDRSNYLSSHSVLLAQMSCMIASMFDLTSESTQYKLAFAAIFHDITLADNLEAMAELSAWLDDKGKPEKKSVLNHAMESVELLEKVHFVPFGVREIIQTHHEKPDGSGYPQGLKESQIDPLSTIFIIAHDLTNFVWVQEREVNLDLFVEGRTQEYHKGLFRKFIQLCQKPGSTR